MAKTEQEPDQCAQTCNIVPFFPGRHYNDSVIPKISSIIPNRSGARTIGQCLESVFSSADDTVEVIVVDDCSIDRSVDIIEKFPVRTRYTLANRDFLADSGTASRELKMNVLSGFLCLAVLGLWLFSRQAPFLYAMPMVIVSNSIINRRLIRAFSETKGTFFAFLAYGYYSTLYAFAVGTGALFGIAEYFLIGNCPGSETKP